MPSPRNKLTSKEYAAMKAANDMRQEAESALVALKAEADALLEKIDTDGEYRKIIQRNAVLMAQLQVSQRELQKIFDKVSERVRARGKKVQINIASGEIAVSGG
jgi:hypothetical protein